MALGFCFFWANARPSGSTLVGMVEAQIVESDINVD